MTDENQRVFQLTDEQLLQAIRTRGNELVTAQALATLVRMFETTKQNMGSGEIGIGLDMAIGLTKLYSGNFAPGHAQHPFPRFNLTVEQIIKISKDKLAKPAKPLIKAPPRPQPLEPTTPEPEPEPPYQPKLKPDSKIGRVVKTILDAQLKQFRAPELSEQLKFDADILPADINNGVVKLYRMKLFSYDTAKKAYVRNH